MIADLIPILVPIFICVVLPVAIALIVCWAKVNNDNKRAEVLIKAIEANNSIDTDKLAEALQKPKKTEREILNMRLQRGCIFSLLGISSLIYGLCCDKEYANIVCCVALPIGIGFLITYFVTRKNIRVDEE